MHNPFDFLASVFVSVLLLLLNDFIIFIDVLSFVDQSKVVVDDLHQPLGIPAQIQELHWTDIIVPHFFFCLLLVKSLPGLDQTMSEMKTHTALV